MIYTENELNKAIEFFQDNLKEDENIIGLSGNLGAGKTTFTKHLLKSLGVTQNVVSPTFVLRRDYEVPQVRLTPDPSPMEKGIVQRIRTSFFQNYDSLKLKVLELITLSNGEGLGVRRIIHIDAYRLEKPQHIYQIVSKEELSYQHNLILIEWPELSENIFDKIFLFEHVDEDTRKISIKEV